MLSWRSNTQWELGMVCVLFYNKHHYCACVHLPLLSVSPHTHTHTLWKPQLHQGTSMANTIQNNTKVTELSARAWVQNQKVSHHTLFTRDKLSISNSTEWLLVLPQSGVSEPPKVLENPPGSPPPTQHIRNISHTHTQDALTGSPGNASYDGAFLNLFESPHWGYLTTIQKCDCILLYFNKNLFFNGFMF